MSWNTYIYGWVAGNSSGRHWYMSTVKHSFCCLLRSISTKYTPEVYHSLLKNSGWKLFSCFGMVGNFSVGNCETSWCNMAKLPSLRITLECGQLPIMPVPSEGLVRKSPSLNMPKHVIILVVITIGRGATLNTSEWDGFVLSFCCWVCVNDGGASNPVATHSNWLHFLWILGHYHVES